GAHGIDFTGQSAGFDDGVAGVVDDVGVVAQTTLHAVGTQAAVEDVVAVVAGQGIVQAVAGGLEVGVAEQAQVFDVGRKGVVDAGENAVEG
nr:hypothetical protein [Tanacetum cinerariifolium]